MAITGQSSTVPPSCGPWLTNQGCGTNAYNGRATIPAGTAFAPVRCLSCHRQSLLHVQLDGCTLACKALVLGCDTQPTMRKYKQPGLCPSPEQQPNKLRTWKGRKPPVNAQSSYNLLARHWYWAVTPSQHAQIQEACERHLYWVMTPSQLCADISSPEQAPEAPTKLTTLCIRPLSSVRFEYAQWM